MAFSIEWPLTPNPAWGGNPGLSIYICINILILYLILTICTDEHYPTQLLPTADAVLQATFSCVFQSISWLFPPYEQHMFIHDKRSLCFLSLTNLSIHKQLKTQASWVSATDSYGEKSFPALQLHLKTWTWQPCIQQELQESDLTNHRSRIRRGDWQDHAWLFAAQQILNSLTNIADLVRCVPFTPFRQSGVIAKVKVNSANLLIQQYLNTLHTDSSSAIRQNYTQH